MQLDTYVDQVQEQLAGAAALGDERTREVAVALAGAASPAVRLAILGAVTAAAGEINAALLDSPGAPSVAVRLEADEVRVAVSDGAVEPSQAPRPDERDASARVSLRLSESLKAEVDAAATRDGVSVNTWLVRAATNAVDAERAYHPGASGAHNNRARNAQRVTGWITG